MSPPQEFETNSLPLLPLSSKQVDNVSLNSYCILNRAVNHCAWHRSFLDLRFFFLNPFFISKNLLISLLCWPTYTKFTRIICIYQARKRFTAARSRKRPWFLDVAKYPFMSGRRLPGCRTFSRLGIFIFFAVYSLKRNINQFE